MYVFSVKDLTKSGDKMKFWSSLEFYFNLCQKDKGGGGGHWQIQISLTKEKYNYCSCLVIIIGETPPGAEAGAVAEA